MLRTILLAVDGFEHSSAAQQSAIVLAQRFKARITAFGVDDSHQEVSPQGKVREFTDGKARMQTALQELQSVADANEVALTTAEAEDDLLTTLKAETTQHDLTVIGCSTGIRLNLRLGRLDAAIDGLVRDGSRPVLAVRGKPVSTDRILVAFDGSAPAARAVHMAALLGLVQGATVQVLTVALNSQAAQMIADRAAALLRSHGGTVTAFGIGADTDPADMILSHAQTFEPGMVVVGAYGHSGLRDMFFGSCTRRMMSKCVSALFLQH